jgi:hypothetical protein
MLQIIKAKPNPAGKDRSPRLLTTQSSLGAEWIDIKNIGSVGYSLKNIQIYHVAYVNDKAEWKLLKDFNSALLIPGLPSGIVMRIHSGSGPLSVLLPEDVQGASRHYFTGKNYVWNNDKIDRPMIYDSKNDKIIDQTYYDAPVADGKFLVRINDKLV